MMEINKSKKLTRKRIVIATLALLLLAAGGASVYLFIVNPSSSPESNGSSIDYNQPTDDQKKSGEQTKQNSVNPNDSSKPNASGSDQSATPVPQDSGKSKVDTTLTSSNQNGGTLQVRFDISTVTNSGTCTLTLKKGSSTVTKTSGVQALAGSSTCKGFDIPTSELSAGVWQTVLHFENSTLIADTTGTAVIQ